MAVFCKKLAAIHPIADRWLAIIDYEEWLAQITNRWLGEVKGRESQELEFETFGRSTSPRAVAVSLWSPGRDSRTNRAIKRLFWNNQHNQHLLDNQTSWLEFSSISFDFFCKSKLYSANFASSRIVFRQPIHNFEFPNITRLMPGCLKSAPTNSTQLKVCENTHMQMVYRPGLSDAAVIN